MDLIKLHGSRSCVPNLDRCGWFFCTAIGIFILVGCDDHSPRREIVGTVTLDGQPLDEATITLVPISGTSGPSAGANVLEGKFQIAPEGGPFAGKFRVEFAKYEIIPGKFMPNKTGEGKGPVAENVIPPKYNAKSELVAKVLPEGENEFHFQLRSK